MRALQEATDEFDAIHSAKAKGMLKDYLIGRLGEAPREEPALPAPEGKAEVRLRARVQIGSLHCVAEVSGGAVLGCG